MKKILVIVGMQNDLVTGPASFEGAASVVEPIRKKMENGSGNTVRFVSDCHATKERYDQTAEAGVFPPHCIEGDDGMKIVSELAGCKWLSDRDPFYKDNPGRFIGPVLEHDVDGSVWDSWTNRGEEYEIHVVGIRASSSVIAMAANLRTEFPCAKIVLDAECVADESDEKLRAAILVAKSIFCEIENEGNKNENQNEKKDND